MKKNKGTVMKTGIEQIAEERATHEVGRDAGAQPACKLREMEEELQRYRGKETVLHQHIGRLQSAYATLMREEDRGYAKGLANGRQIAVLACVFALFALLSGIAAPVVGLWPMAALVVLGGLASFFVLMAFAPQKKWGSSPGWRSSFDGFDAALRAKRERLQTAEKDFGVDCMKTGIEQIAEERATHDAKGWTATHDDGHKFGELAEAAAELAADETCVDTVNLGDKDDAWGLVAKTKKEGGRLRQLVVAGALIAAEIDRLQRKGSR